MRRMATLLGFCCAALSTAGPAAAAPPADLQAAPSATGLGDKLLLSANASRLSGTTGGGGGQLDWLHDLDPATKTAAGVEYQSLAGGNWLVGSLIAAHACDPDSSSMRDCSLSGEVHEGAGNTGAHSFRYTILAAGFSHAVGRELIVQLEDRYVDVDTSLGHLPKVSLAYLSGSRLLTTLSYAHSVGGNLATELLAARIDLYQPRWRSLAGVVYGNAAPAIVNLQSAPAPAGHILKEGFLGFARSVRDGELQLLADYLGLGDSKRLTLTLSYTVPVRP
jgi:hypothetical protein